MQRGKGSPSVGAHACRCMMRASGALPDAMPEPRWPQIQRWILLGEGNCRVQKPHPPALWASTFRSRGSLPGKSWFPGERAAAELHAAVHLAKRWAARMAWGWSPGCEWNLTTCGGEGAEGPPFVCGTTHQWRVRWPPQADVGAQSRAPMSRQAQVGRGFAVCGGTDV